MQVVCEQSNTINDVRCAVCGQGFVVQWAPILPALRIETRTRIIHALRRQHQVGASSHHAHPQARFAVSTVSPEPRISVPSIW